MRRDHKTPREVAKRKPERRRMKYDGKPTSKRRKSSGRMDVTIPLIDVIRQRRTNTTSTTLAVAVMLKGDKRATLRASEALATIG
jgi:hypothetical protein